MVSVTLLVSWGVLAIENPYLIAGVLLQVLFLGCVLIGMHCPIIGFILFLIYIGGLIILIRYCVMILPRNKFVRFNVFSFTALLVGLGIREGLYRRRVFPFGLMFRSSIILLVSLLLYLVILSIVNIIDYSRGIIKFYDKYYFIYCKNADTLFPHNSYNIDFIQKHIR